MEMIDLKSFRIANKLSQTQLAEYLGVLQGFISQMEKGLRPVPAAIISKIEDNSAGWDTSMLLSGDAPRITTHATGHSNASVSINSSNRQSASPAHAAALAEKDTRIAVLEKENQLLREQIEFLKTLIK